MKIFAFLTVDFRRSTFAQKIPPAVIFTSTDGVAAV
jgi:hypothetical protein